MALVIRESWADKVKFIGIFLMLLGHNALANDKLFDFIYSFHMPLFFIISGYFSNNKNDLFKDYLLKNIKCLLIPYIFFYLLTLPFGYFVIWAHPYNHPYSSPVDFLLKPLIGMLTVETTSFAFHSNGPSWFFVALFWVKMLFYIPKKYKCNCLSLIASCLGCVCILFLIKWCDMNFYTRIDTALLAFPLYVFGYIIRNYTNVVNYIRQMSICYNILGILFSFGLCYIFCMINGHVEFSAASYGKDLLLMYVNAVIGTLGVIILSCIIPDNKYLTIIGGGTGIILGLHSPIQQLVKEVFKAMFNIPTHDYSFIVALLIVILVLIIHIPIIILFNKKIPFLIGK